MALGAAQAKNRSAGTFITQKLEGNKKVKPGLFGVDHRRQLVISQPAPGLVLSLLPPELKLDASVDETVERWVHRAPASTPLGRRTMGHLLEGQTFENRSQAQFERLADGHGTVEEPILDQQGHHLHS